MTTKNSSKQTMKSRSESDILNACYSNLTTPDFFDFCAERLKRNSGIEFKVDNQNQNVIEALCLYHLDNPGFEKMNDKWSLKKGLLIMGPVGTGKTTIMELFKETPKVYMSRINCSKVADDYSTDGVNVINRLSWKKELAYNESIFSHKVSGFCFDDLGTEATGIYFGQHRNVMTDIINNRYNKRLPFTLTSVTTNLNADEIQDMYGLRVRDRMKEMFNLIVLKGKSRRN